MALRLILPINSILRRVIHTTPASYKGHAKWQNIKHIKAANDQFKARLIAKQMRLIRLAVQGTFGLKFIFKSSETLTNFKFHI